MMGKTLITTQQPLKSLDNLEGPFGEKMNTWAFFNTDSQQSFISPEIVCRLNLPVLERVTIQLAAFGNNSTSCLLDIAKEKVQLGYRRFTAKLLLHDQVSMELNCPGIYEVSQQLERQEYQLAGHHITSDVLTEIEVLIGVDYFSCFIPHQRRAKGMNLFVTRDRGVIPFEPLPKWVSEQVTNALLVCANFVWEWSWHISVVEVRADWHIKRGVFSERARNNIENSIQHSKVWVRI